MAVYPPVILNTNKRLELDRPRTAIFLQVCILQFIDNPFCFGLVEQATIEATGFKVELSIVVRTYLWAGGSSGISGEVFGKFIGMETQVAPRHGRRHQYCF